MLANSFSFLPVLAVAPASPKWTLLSDFSLAEYLRAASSPAERRQRLASRLGEVVEAGNIALIDAPVCRPEDHIGELLKLSQGRPVLVIGSDSSLRGIVTPFDVL
jgi:hypothetical protein